MFATGRKVVCREALDPRDHVLKSVKKLYHSTQAADERIPFRWLRDSATSRTSWRPGTGKWSPHLLVTADADRPDDATGFVFGAHVPDYGGYVSYLGVAARARNQGLGRRLFTQMFKVLEADAGFEGVPLPFVVWESRRPAPDAPPEAHANWRARTRLFDAVGGRRLDGADVLTPNYSEAGGPPVALQLFLRPWDTPAEAFDPDRLREVVAGLYRGVYRRGPGDELFDASLPPGVRPRLVPAADP